MDKTKHEVLKLEAIIRYGKRNNDFVSRDYILEKLNDILNDREIIVHPDIIKEMNLDIQK